MRPGRTLAGRIFERVLLVVILAVAAFDFAGIIIRALANSME